MALRPQIALASADGRATTIRALGSRGDGNSLLGLVTEDGRATIREIPIEEVGRIGPLGQVVQTLDRPGYQPLDLTIIDGVVGSSIGMSETLRPVDHGTTTEPPTDEELSEPLGPFSVPDGVEDLIVRPDHSENATSFSVALPGAGLARATKAGSTASVIVNAAFADGDHLSETSVLVDGHLLPIPAAGEVVGASVTVDASGAVVVALDVLGVGVEVWELAKRASSFSRSGELTGAVAGASGITLDGRVFTLTQGSGGQLNAHMFVGGRWLEFPGVALAAGHGHALPVRGHPSGRWVMSNGDVVDIEGMRP
ncbi:MAG: hypothetical protein OES24_15625 [Acidimicrobiia bacterium]|nr:hypothetical protein [Acidimicrobiia bacterium]